MQQHEQTVKGVLADVVWAQVEVVRVLVGSFCTSLDMHVCTL